MNNIHNIQYKHIWTHITISTILFVYKHYMHDTRRYIHTITNNSVSVKARKVTLPGITLMEK